MAGINDELNTNFEPYRVGIFNMQRSVRGSASIYHLIKNKPLDYIFFINQITELFTHLKIFFF